MCAFYESKVLQRKWNPSGRLFGTPTGNPLIINQYTVQLLQTNPCHAVSQFLSLKLFIGKHTSPYVIRNLHQIHYVKKVTNILYLEITIETDRHNLQGSCQDLPSSFISLYPPPPLPTTPLPPVSLPPSLPLSLHSSFFQTTLSTKKTNRAGRRAEFPKLLLYPEGLRTRARRDTARHTLWIFLSFPLRAEKQNRPQTYGARERERGPCSKAVLYCNPGKQWALRRPYCSPHAGRKTL